MYYGAWSPQDYEDTIKSLKAQVNILSQRVTILQEELDRRRPPNPRLTSTPLPSLTSLPTVTKTTTTTTTPRWSCRRMNIWCSSLTYLFMGAAFLLLNFTKQIFNPLSSDRFYCFTHLFECSASVCVCVYYRICVCTIELLYLLHNKVWPSIPYVKCTPAIINWTLEDQ